MTYADLLYSIIYVIQKDFFYIFSYKFNIKILI